MRRLLALLALTAGPPLVACGDDASVAGRSFDASPAVDATLDSPRDSSSAGDGPDLDAPFDSDASTPTRTRTALSGSFRFRGTNDLVSAEAPTFDDSSWESITLPHTWDAMATASGAHRPFVAWSKAWYRTRFRTHRPGRSRTYLYFEGVATIADVFVNGKKLGQHRGAFTRFVFDATDALAADGDNVLAVMVSNADADTADTLPTQAIEHAYFDVYGGVYRKAFVIETDAVHVDPTDYASSGVYLTQTHVDATSAELRVDTVLRNGDTSAHPIEVLHRLVDREGHDVQVLHDTVTVVAGGRGRSTVSTKVPTPHLWGPKDPYLYRVVTELAVDGVVRDAVEERLGFRTFELSPNDFRVNGASMPLRGVSKHQETEAHQSAVTDDELIEDWNTLQELGVNFVRLVHYPHAELEYRLADERGVVVWAENGLTRGAPYSATGEQISRELVRQNYNHPSIAFFSAGNESAPDGDAYATWRDAVVRYGKAIKEEDPTRPVVFASNSSFTDPAIDFIAHNLYEGWYGGAAWDFDADAKALHFVTETGGRAVSTQHTDYGAERLSLGTFEPEEYLQLITESHTQIAFRDEAASVPLYTWWVFRDFLLDGRPHGVNDSGLVTYDGKRRKDSFYLLQSFLRPDFPVVHFASATHFVRRGAASNGVKVYSNRKTLHLSINGEDVGARSNGDYRQGVHVVENVFFWDAPLHQGMNDLVASDGSGNEARASIYFAGGDGLPARTSPVPIVSSLSSSNGKNPAYFFDHAIEQDFPLFDEIDGTSDNTFAELPALVSGARPIVTARTSKVENLTDLTFRIDPSFASADVFVIAAAGAAPPPFVAAAGLVDAGVPCTVRDASMDRVRCNVFQKHVAGGTTIRIPGATLDYVVLVRPGV